MCNIDNWLLVICLSSGVDNLPPQKVRPLFLTGSECCIRAAGSPPAAVARWLLDNMQCGRGQRRQRTVLCLSVSMEMVVHRVVWPGWGGPV